MSGILVKNASFIEKQKMVVSMLDSTATMDNGISLAGKHDKEGNAVEFWRQGQAEVH